MTASERRARRAMEQDRARAARIRKASAPRRWSLAWLLWLAAFLCVEIPAAIAEHRAAKRGRYLVATLSRHTWAYFPWVWRRLVLAAFVGVFAGHMALGPGEWWTGAPALIVAGVPVLLIWSSGACRDLRDKWGW